MPKAKNNENAPPVLETKRTRTRKKSEHVAQDKSLWRPSIIAQHEKINKALAVAQYHINASNLEGLDYKTKSTTVRAKAGVFTRPMYLYNEREVEMRAWEKHGGPEGFEAMLKTKREKWYQRHGHHSGKFFPQPRWYMPQETAPAPLGDSSTNHVATVPKPVPKTIDETVETPALYDMKQTMIRDGKEWLWNELHHCFLSQESDPWPQDGGRRREKVITAAMPDFVMKYDPRPSESESVMGSPSFRALKEVLARATVYNGGLDEQEGLSKWETYSPEWDISFDWSPDYYKEVYVALTRVIDEHGFDGWKRARWLVYDRYIECNLGDIHYYDVLERSDPNFGKVI